MILVTGASGFVGRHVVQALRAGGRDVRALVRDPRKGDALVANGATLAQGDVTDAASMRDAVAGCDTVIHLVAIRQGSNAEFQRVVVEGTRNVLTAAKDAGVQRFVHMGALGTSLENKDAVPYLGAKWAQEQDVKASGIPYVIFRPSFIFSDDGGILPTFTKLAKIAPVTPVIGDGRQRIQPIWADDVGAYFAKAVDLASATDQTFELGGPDAVTWNEFWDRLKRRLGKSRPSVHVPFSIMRLNALVTERLPGNIPLTRDLLKMLQLGDNVVMDTSAVEIFGIPLKPLDEQLRLAV